MLAGPPPKFGARTVGALLGAVNGPPASSAAGLVEMPTTIVFVIVWFAICWLSTLLGSSTMSCVIVPPGAMVATYCGMRGVFVSATV